MAAARRRRATTTGILLATCVLGVSVLVCPPPARAAFTCRAEVDRHSVPLGEEVRLTVTAQGDVGWTPEVKLPALKGVRVFGGGTNQRMTTVNGKAETFVSRTYFLRVEDAGDFTIGPVRITGNGSACETEPIAISVTAARTVPPADSGNRVRQPSPSDRQPVTPTGDNVPGGDIFVTLEVDQDDIWVGQQVTLTFRYWKRVPPWRNPTYTPPRTEGFWREDLGSERNYQRVWQGRRYDVVEINYALFPTRAGELVIEPAELVFQEDLFERFLTQRSNRRGPRTLRTDPVLVIVRQLPTPQPAGFSGIVASQLSMTSAVDRDSVPRGEAVGLRLELLSDGFLKGFRGLTLPPIKAARVHDSAESFATRRDVQKLIGHVSVEKVVVPESEGFLRIPQIEVVWFDTQRGNYRTARTPWRDIVVEPSDRPLPGQEGSGFLRNEIARLSEDLGFILPAPASLLRREQPITGGLVWWIALLTPAVLLTGLRYLLTRLGADRRDPAGRRRRRSLAVALAELKVAGLAESDAERSLALARAITGFVADRMDEPVAAIGVIEIRAYCEQAGRIELGQRLADILDQCDRARFGGGGGPREGVVEDVVQALTALARRSSAGTGGSAIATGLALGVACALLSLASVPSASAQDGDRPGADPARLLAEGNQAYTEGRIADALGLYEQARERGANDAVLHYNLGNAYARQGQLGQSVASYLRAQRLAPRQRDISANLGWVRGHLQDLELADEPLPLFIAQAAAVVGFLSLDEWGLLLVVLVWVTAGLVAWGWNRETFAPGLRRLLLASAALLTLALAVTAGRWYQEQVRELAVVITETAEVRSGPAENFSVLFEVHDGLTLNIEGRRDDWVRVGLGGEWVGWLPAADVESVRDWRRSSRDQSPGR